MDQGVFSWKPRSRTPIPFRIHTVSEPAAQNPDTQNLRYTKLGRELYPLDDISEDAF